MIFDLLLYGFCRYLYDNIGMLHMVYAEIISRIFSFRLEDSPMMVCGLLVAMCAAIFALFKHLAVELAAIGRVREIEQRRNNLETAENFQRLLVVASLFCLFALSVTISRCLFPELKLDFLTQHATFLILLILIFLAAVIGDFSFRLRHRRLVISASTIEAVVYLACNRVVKGNLMNLSFLDGNRYMDVILEDGSTTSIDTHEVGTVFLRGCPVNDTTDHPLSRGWFREGPKRLTITFPREEVFDNTWYYDRVGFRVMEIHKPTTNTRYTIVRTTMVEDVHSDVPDYQA